MSTIRICVFGDSITWGASDNEKGGWVNRLRLELENSQNEDWTPVYNLGITGDTSKKLLKRFKNESEARGPDIVIFAIGINDSALFRGGHLTEINEFRENLELLAKEARKFTPKIMFLGLNSVDESKTTPYIWDKELSFNNESIARYNQEIENFCQANKLKFKEISGLLDKNDLEEDGVHPNPAGHEKIFNVVRDFLLKNECIT